MNSTNIGLNIKFGKIFSYFITIMGIKCLTNDKKRPEISIESSPYTLLTILVSTIVCHCVNKFFCEFRNNFD